MRHPLPHPPIEHGCCTFFQVAGDSMIEYREGVSERILTVRCPSDGEEMNPAWEGGLKGVAGKVRIGR